MLSFHPSSHSLGETSQCPGCLTQTALGDTAMTRKAFSSSTVIISTTCTCRFGKGLGFALLKSKFPMQQGTAELLQL